MAVHLYTFCLSLYYLFVVAFKWKDEKIREAEKWMHPIIITMATGFATSGIPLKLYNDAHLWCWISSIPETCENGLSPSGSGECERGLHAWIFRWAYYYGPVWFCIVGVTICMAMVVYYAYQDEKQTRRFRRRHSATRNGLDSLRTMTRDVICQAFLYVLVFYITRTFPTVTRVHEMLGQEFPYFVIFIQAFVGPTHGFWNSLIYFRPRYMRYRRRTQSFTQQTSFYRVLRNSVPFRRNSPNNNPAPNVSRIFVGASELEREDNDLDVLESDLLDEWRSSVLENKSSRRQESIQSLCDSIRSIHSLNAVITDLPLPDTRRSLDAAQALAHEEKPETATEVQGMKEEEERKHDIGNDETDKLDLDDTEPAANGRIVWGFHST